MVFPFVAAITTPGVEGTFHESLSVSEIVS